MQTINRSPILFILYGVFTLSTVWGDAPPQIAEKKALGSIAEEWDAALDMHDLTALSIALAKVEREVAIFNESGATNILEVREWQPLLKRVGDLYCALSQESVRMGRPERWRYLEATEGFGSIHLDLMESASPGSEAKLDFVDSVAELAESLRIPEIYWHAWFYPQPSHYNASYLASVSSQTTLAVVLSAMEEGKGKVTYDLPGDYLKCSHGIALGVIPAFKILRELVKSSSLDDTSRKRIAEYITRFAHVYERGGAYSRMQQDYAEARDYSLRKAALDILNEMCVDADASIVTYVLADAPEVKCGIERCTDGGMSLQAFVSAMGCDE
ncbi:MAG: hypothetical protein GC168_02290 [Candidatus Hydrogenedens sp.]|nr:hypothetical protein [Candidatus Hydrogenedens sp.]